eukprot:3595655-Rhodomonas_salina.1
MQHRKSSPCSGSEPERAGAAGGVRHRRGEVDASAVWDLSERTPSYSPEAVSARRGGLRFLYHPPPKSTRANKSTRGTQSTRRKSPHCKWLCRWTPRGDPHVLWVRVRCILCVLFLVFALGVLFGA